MKLSKLYNVFAACFDGAFQRVVCAMRSLGSMPSECMNHAHPQGEHIRLCAYVQCSKRDRRKPKKSRVLINQNAACCVDSPCLVVSDNAIPKYRFIDSGLCSDCLFSYYCDDKDKRCLSVNSPYDFYFDELDFQTDLF